MKNLSVYKGVFKQKQYLKLISANIVNRFGDSIDAIALSWVAYQVTGSATWMAIVFAFNALPSIVFMPFAGAWVESMNKKVVMIITDLCRGVIVIALAFLFINELLSPWIIVASTLFISTVEAFRIPAGMAIVPLTLSKDHYESGMSLNASLSQVSMVIGLAMAGAIIGVIGVVGAMLIDAATFFISAFSISLINIKHVVSEAKKSPTLHLIKEGFLYLKNVKIIFYLCMFGVAMNFIFSPISVLQTPYVVDVLKQEAYALSIIGVANVGGMAFGSLIFPILTQKISRQKILGLSGIGIGVAFISLTLLNDQMPILTLYIFLAIISLGFGSMAGLLQTSVSVSFMTHVDQKYIARAGSIFNALVSASVPLSSFILSGIALLFEIPQIMILYGILSIVLFVVVIFSKKLVTL
jgi:MFS transporter, DHA3 family, macrolide efflux protein